MLQPTRRCFKHDVFVSPFPCNTLNRTSLEWSSGISKKHWLNFVRKTEHIVTVYNLEGLHYWHKYITERQNVFNALQKHAQHLKQLPTRERLSCRCWPSDSTFSIPKATVATLLHLPGHDWIILWLWSYDVGLFAFFGIISPGKQIL